MRKEFLKTYSPCPECKMILKATIFNENGSLIMEKTCPEHGNFTFTFSKNTGFYEEVYSRKDTLSEKKNLDNFAIYKNTDEHIKYCHEVYIDLTENCNLTCPQCFAAANTEKKPLIKKEKVFEYIPRLRKYKPIVSFCGGEPTLHEDLPEIISRFTQEGFIVRLLSNGIKFTDTNFLKELKHAGLKWVILQFDGFKEDTYKLFRGRPLLDIKMEVIRRLTENKFFLLLAVMIAEGVNSDEVGKIIEFAIKTPYIVQVGFLPCANQGRYFLNAMALEPYELMDKIESETKNTITKNDFLMTLKLGKVFNKITGNFAFKPRTCQFGVFLYHDNEVAFPIHRLINPIFLLKHIKRTPRILNLLKHILNWESSPYHSNLLGVTIERFRDADTIDLVDATNCTKAYITETGAIPNCIYNSIIRGR